VRGPGEALKGLLAEFDAHNQGKTLDDDVTLAFVEVLQ
jgi:hypothetical protein